MENAKRLTLTQIQKMFTGIYGKRNSAMYGSANLLLRVFEEMAVISESFRKEDHNGLDSLIAGLFGWLLGFCSNERIDLAGAVFGKYHGACPYCGRTMHCVCISAETKPAAWRKRADTCMPNSLPEWQSMFKNIYGRVNKVAGRDKCWLHFQEELGEVSGTFRRKERVGLRDELADVFAWLVAFCNNSGINLEAAVLSRYQGKCDKCGQAKCVCSLV